ncbi:MAG: helix-turn-helix transcriptional regulator [Opitutales bacterium]|nr:helix-turn-helix transcriptional regulator [Opitutales bacterium]
MPVTFPCPIHADREEVRSPAYFWDNRVRAESPQVIVQRTISGEAFFASGSGRTLVGTGQAMLFTHREDSAYGYPEGGTEPLVLEFVSMQPGAGLRELFDAVRGEFGSVVRMDSGGEAARWLTALRRALNGRAPVGWRMGEACFRLLLAIRAEQQDLREAEDPVVTLRRRLEEDFRQPIQIKQVADECGRTREHLIRSFRARYGCTPGAFLHRLRMEHAARLFLDSRLPLQAVAQRCGYVHARSFARAFKSHFGHPPPSR